MRLDRFLSEQQSEGIQDSTGAFTIDAQTARRKMAAFQLADPGAYILKFVQAAVAAQASAIKLVAGREELTLEVNGPPSELSKPSALASALLNIASLKRSPLRHLAVGLNAACAQGVAEARWETRLGSLILTPDAVTVNEVVYPGLRLVVRKQRSLWKWFIGTVFADELHSLNSHCAYAPIEMSIDGREVERNTWSRFSSPPIDHVGLPEPHFLLERILPGQGLRLHFPAGRAYDPSSSHRRVWKGHKTVQGAPATVAPPLLIDGWTDTPGSLEAQSVLGIAPTAIGPGRWTAVIDGVSLPALEADLGHPGAQIVFAAPNLATDLSEFRLVEDAALAETLTATRDLIRSTTEGVPRLEIQLALGRSGLDGQRLEQVTSRVMDLLTGHGEGPVRTVEDLLLRHFAGSAVNLAPDIPADKLANAKTAHAGNLLPDETILALYDDTMFRSAKDGVVISGLRVCWKAALRSPNFALWEELPHLQPKAEPGKIALIGGEIITAIDNNVAILLGAFLTEVAKLSLQPYHKFDPSEAFVIESGLKFLGKADKIRYHPYIPAAWLRTFGEIYGSLWVAEEIPLVAYNDTLMGSAEQGFVATTKRLLWKNSLAESQSLAWKKMLPGEVGPANLGFRIGQHTLMAHVSELRDPMIGFVRTMAAQ